MIKLVGLGAQDSFEDAQKFVERHGTRSFPMLWDPDSESWRQLGVTSTPTFALFDRQGRPFHLFVGPFDEDGILEQARRA